MEFHCHATHNIQNLIPPTHSLTRLLAPVGASLRLNNEPPFYDI